MENKRTEKADSKAPLLIKRSKVGNSDMAEETSWKKPWGKDVADEESDIYSSEWMTQQSSKEKLGQDISILGDHHQFEDLLPGMVRELVREDDAAVPESRARRRHQADRHRSKLLPVYLGPFSLVTCPALQPHASPPGDCFTTRSTIDEERRTRVGFGFGTSEDKLAG
ncbi:hypothetical protein SAY87_012761 [Trapa incisa]|uniref:Uncharacterized protein n=1 Tax=Trapa incisa TaxID=236973 RepID=A0AAN7GQM2_9MYRT|nr:hypothetical protein SAY87_012761 [Trapa incisa]